jgi:hypothetical protein
VYNTAPECGAVEEGSLEVTAPTKCSCDTICSFTDVYCRHHQEHAVNEIQLDCRSDLANRPIGLVYNDRSSIDDLTFQPSHTSRRPLCNLYCSSRYDTIADRKIELRCLSSDAGIAGGGRRNRSWVPWAQVLRYELTVRFVGTANGVGPSQTRPFSTLHRNTSLL